MSWKPCATAAQLMHASQQESITPTHPTAKTGATISSREEEEEEEGEKETRHLRSAEGGNKPPLEKLHIN